MVTLYSDIKDKSTCDCCFYIEQEHMSLSQQREVVDKWSYRHITLVLYAEDDSMANAATPPQSTVEEYEVMLSSDVTSPSLAYSNPRGLLEKRRKLEKEIRKLEKATASSVIIIVCDLIIVHTYVGDEQDPDEIE